MKTQLQLYNEAHNKIAERNEIMSEWVRNGEITKDELRLLITKRPDRYGMYEGLIEHCVDELSA